MPNELTIAAIAKDEERYLSEWVAFHLAIGVDHLLIYSNDATVAQNSLLADLSCRDARVEWMDWPSVDGVSPQVSAYEQAVKVSETEWIAFLDVDEFLVPHHHESIKSWLETVPADVSSVHVNWAGFGSSGKTNSDYELVTRAFHGAADRDWGNNRHFKTIARRNLITRVSVHNIVADGRRCLSDFEEFETLLDGKSRRICHQGIQINHYQCKTYPEFSARMARGDANMPKSHPQKERDGSFERFRALDRNEREDRSIRRFDRIVDDELQRLVAPPPHQGIM